MQRHVANFMKKVFILSTILVVLFNAGNYFIDANLGLYNSESNKEKSENKQNFKNANSSYLGASGVAISTNIGMRFKRSSEIPVSIYKEVMSIEEVIANRQEAKTELIGEHMVTLEEYRNVLKTNVKNLIGNTYNKTAIFDAFVEQLEYRYEIGAVNQNNLLKQRDTLVAAMANANANIDTLKLKITEDFKNNDDTASLENIDNYLALKKEFYFARTYIVYMNQFLSEYNFLNTYNRKLINLLKTNKHAIIINTYVVIPDETGIGGLRSMNLIFTEDEIIK